MTKTHIDSLENKQKILEFFLANSIKTGWNKYNLCQAVADIGIDSDNYFLIFPDGLNELTEFFFNQNNQSMIDYFKSQDLSQFRVHEKVKLAIKFLLEKNFNNKESLKKLASFLGQVKNIIFGFRLAYKTADSIWFVVGDKSTDFNFFSKRIILTRILVRVFHFFVNNQSNDFEKIMDFVNKEIKKVMRIQIVKFKIKNCFDKTKNYSNKFFEEGFNKETLSENLKKLPFIRLFNKDL